MIPKLLGRKRSRGQTLVEFAFVLPLIVLLIFGAIELGRAVYVYNTLANSARQGARVAAVNQNTGNGQCDPQNRASWSITTCAVNAGIQLDDPTSADSTNRFTASNVAICFYESDGSVCTGTQVLGDSCIQRALTPPCIARVTVTYPYRPWTPIISDVVGNISMSSTSEMPVESWFP
jgi:Flp pilus assembly protein TadG